VDNSAGTSNMDDSQILLGLSLSDWEHLSKALALLGALLFFGYKVVSGFMVTNMSLKPGCARQPTADEKFDDLTISVTLSKGDRGSVAIHDAAARLYDAAGVGSDPVPLNSIARLSFVSQAIGNITQKKIAWDVRSKSSPFLKLTPGDEMTLSAHCKVSSIDTCRVEVIVLGQRINSSFTAQWRGSVVVVPLTPKQRRDAA
jgi:hypothetical protein